MMCMRVERDRVRRCRIYHIARSTATVMIHRSGIVKTVVLKFSAQHTFEKQ